MRPFRQTAILISLALSILFTRTLAAAEAPSARPYAPFEFLIGEWAISAESGGPALGIARFRWGPNQSYIWYSSSFLVNGSERPHFEGLLVWNGVHKNLDMLIAMDLERGLAQETGVMSVDPDGTVVREITASFSEGTHPIGQPVVGPEGATARFRQTFRQAGTDKVLTRVMRQAGKDWVATFPGSDRLLMTRRPGAAP
ncbi:MAG TPA: hypothetical protein VF376_05425 [Thermoanaerobaculia bacterium]